MLKPTLAAPFTHALSRTPSSLHPSSLVAVGVEAKGSSASWILRVDTQGLVPDRWSYESPVT